MDPSPKVYRFYLYILNTDVGSFGSVYFDHIKEIKYIPSLTPIITITHQNLKSSGLKLVHINCRSLLKKVDEIILHFKHCDIVCCSETWLKPELSGALINFPDKILY